MNQLTGKHVKLIRADHAIFHLSFTDDDRTLISGSSDGVVRYWQI